MYQQPPYPYPAGYGFQPSPGHRASYSQTPNPFGTHSKHQRRSSQQVPPSSFYSARVPPQYDSRYAHYSSPRNPAGDHVSSGFHQFTSPRGQTRYNRAPDARRSSATYRRHDSSDDDDTEEYNQRLCEYYRRLAADYYRYYYQGRDSSYASREKEPPLPSKTPKANQSRPRRASYAAEQSVPPHMRPQTTPPKQSTRKSSKAKEAAPEKPQATEHDRLRCKIPAGYSLKNWDPTEEPITLLGSVFDANSLGKWIYDWTCYSYGTGAPLTDTAGDLWLLLINLAGKIRRADERIEEIRQEDNRELVHDFLESGERLWIRFRKLLKGCETFMYHEAQEHSGQKNPKKLGSDSGVAFVECMFGRDRELGATEKLMANIRLWSMRFDANVDSILRDYDA